ncbi:MAG: P-type DNA transfer protein VirB5 [Methylococcaceae bacterium]|nr:P-type DNA transfer protein VirB5 [Methylococcaceae bacterium]
MTLLNKSIGTVAIAISLCGGNNALAVDIVTDITPTTIAGWSAQAASWGTQLQRMTNQFNQLKSTYDSMNGSRGMADLVNNPAARQYLPANYQDILSSGYGNWASIRSSAKVMGIEDTTLNPTSDVAKAFESTARQSALNRATMEDGYNQASQRFSSIQVLLDKVNAAPDQKDIADLQARIQAEQVMMQNESTKLAMLGQLAQAQRDLSNQQAMEIGMKSTRGDVPRF